MGNKVGLDIGWGRMREVEGDCLYFCKSNWINDGASWWEEKVVGLGGRKK